MDSSQQNNNIQEGWYEDPNNPSQWRWWDGSNWTERVYQTTEAEPQIAVAEYHDPEATIHFEEPSSYRNLFYIVVVFLIIGLLMVGFML